MRRTSDIPNMPDRSERMGEILVDCYGMQEELVAFEVYLDEAGDYPFEAIWRDVDEPGHAEPVTVIGVADTDNRRGVLLEIERKGKSRRVVAEQIHASDENSVNATVLDDYRYWIERGGLHIDF